MSPLTFLHLTQVVEDLPFDETTLKSIICAWGSYYGMTKRQSHDVVRLALSGRESGPDLYAMILVMGRGRVLHRFYRFVEYLANPDKGSLQGFNPTHQSPINQALSSFSLWECEKALSRRL